MNSLLNNFVGFEMTTEQGMNTTGGTSSVESKKEERAAKKAERQAARAERRAERNSCECTC